MTNVAELQARIDNGLLPPGRVLTCTPFSCNELERLLAIARAAEGALLFARPVDLQAAVTQGGYPDLRQALDALEALHSQASDEGKA